MCTGCGACYSACPKQSVELVNLPNIGIRPRVNSAGCEGCNVCMAVCPGHEVVAAAPMDRVRSEDDHEIGWTLEIWGGFAWYHEFRYRGSSGGVLSALALYCLEREGMEFVQHTAAADN